VRSSGVREGLRAVVDLRGDYSTEVPQQAWIRADPGGRPGTVTCGDGRGWTCCLLFASRGSGADAAGPVVAGGPEGPDRCLLCALLIACPPAGIAWLLASRHRSRALQRRAVTAAGAWSSGAGGAAARGVEGRRAEDR
jgi:hypothetical protein